MRPVLIVMLREPRPGRVKTRLARGIGRIPATWWYRHQSAALIRRLRDPRWQIVLAVTPDRAAKGRGPWPNDLPRLPQGGGDLGGRMVRLLRAFAPSPVLLVGSDIPALKPQHLAAAFKALKGNDAVLGPATDGGYWAIGLRGAAGRRLPRLADVRWSGPHALADTLAALSRLRIALADRLGDVDEAADL